MKQDYRNPPPAIPATPSLRDRRLALGRDAILSLREACRLMPIREADARAMLRKAGVINTLGNKPVVVWGDVLALLEGRKDDGGGCPPAPAPRAAFRRSGVL